MFEMAADGNIASSSDLAVGAKALETGIWGAFKNVEINLPQIRDEKYKAQVLKEANEILERAKKGLKMVEEILGGRK